MKTDKSIIREAWQPLPHAGPDCFRNRILFRLRIFFDLEVSTTYKHARSFLHSTKGDVLEIGCGLKPYRHLIPSHVKYCAIDRETSQSEFHYKSDDVIYYDGDTFPLKDNSFDYIFHTEVLEHVYALADFLNESYRVLRKGGKMFFTVPFAARYHYIPYDYWRFTPACLDRLLQDAGFRNIKIKNRGNDIVVGLCKINAIFYRLIFKQYSNQIVKIANMLFIGFIFCIPILFLTFICHAAIILKIGSADDPLGYSVYCDKRIE